MEQIKTCECCGHTLPVSAFSKAYKHICKECYAKKMKTKRANHKTGTCKHKVFRPYEKVLLVSHVCINKKEKAPASYVWLPVFYLYFDEVEQCHLLSNNVFIDIEHENEIIPFKGNEHLAGKPVER